MAPATGLPLEDLTRINEEIEKFDISDNADRLEDMEDNIDVTSVVEKEILAMVRKEKEESWLMGWGLTDGFTSFSRQTAKLCTNLSFVMEQTAA